MYKIAFGSVPKDGGTFTFYRNLRPALVNHGVDLRCVSIGKRESGLIEEAYVDEGCVLLAQDTHKVKKQSMAFAKWCEQEQVDIVMAINSEAILSALPHLPRRIRVLSRCANAFDEGYRVTMSCRERLMRIIALTPRLKKDLIEHYEADPDMIHLIPNGIDPAPFQKLESRGQKTEVRDQGAAPVKYASLISRAKEGSTSEIHSADFPAQEGQKTEVIQLGFMGRLEHKQKGVLYLIEIVRRLKQLEVPFRLRIAGKGIHRSILEKELKPHTSSGEVEFLGALTKDEVPVFLKSIDVYLLTSHFEGCPNALLEAMMAGCAPVAFLINGITDFVLKHNRTGMIAPMSDCTAFAKYVAQLAQDRWLRQRISKSAFTEAHTRFVPEVAAGKYAGIIHDVMEEPLPDYETLPWSQFRIDPVYRRRWTSYLPKGIKRRVRAALNR
jgi:glycosyltransferase involved in cell wall biosynthesis